MQNINQLIYVTFDVRVKYDPDISFDTLWRVRFIPYCVFSNMALMLSFYLRISQCALYTAIIWMHRSRQKVSHVTEVETLACICLAHATHSLFVPMTRWIDIPRLLHK